MPNRIVHILTFLVAAICLLNVPSFLLATRGIGYLATYFLTACLLILWLFFLPKRRFSSNIALQLYFATTGSYLFLSVMNLLIFQQNQATAGGWRVTDDWIYDVRVVLQNILVTYIAYKSLLFAHQNKRLHPTLNIWLALMVIGAALTPLSPLLGFYHSGFFIAKELGSASGSLVRPAGIYMNPNVAGFHAVLTLIFGLTLLFRRRNSWVLTFLIVAISIFSALATFSKGAILMSVMVLAVYFSIAFRNFSSLPRPNRRTLLVVSSLVVVSLIQLTAFVVASYNQLSKFQQERLDQILGILNGQVNSQTTTNRSDLAQVGIDFIADSPLWGWGFGAFHYIRSGNDAGIHNMFLLLMGESGIVPTLLFGLFFMVAGVRSWQLRKVEYRFFCLAFLFVALFFANGNHNLFDTYEVSFMFGLVCALIKIDAIERTQTIENQFFTPNTEGATTT